MLDHSRHRGESATKTVKFFAAHTVNCVICKNLTRIEWMLLNFTPVIQQNCHQPGRNFEKSFCAVDRLKFYGPVMCRNRPDAGNIIPITRLLPGCFTFCKTCHVIYLYGYFKNCQLWVLKYTTISITFKWDQILSWIYEVISYNMS